MNDVVLSPSQEAACNEFRGFLQDRDAKDFLLSGFAGSGKSFLVKHLITVTSEEHELLKHIVPNIVRPKFLFTATTNKAASVLEEISGTAIGEGTTIHKMLGLGLDVNYRTGAKTLKQKYPPKADLNNTILVIDEASMINKQLLSCIEKVTDNFVNVKILYVGDAYQLPPVKEETCPIFHKTGYSQFLTDIQRQAADSPIISYAHKFREIVDDEELPWPDVPHDGENIIFYEDKTKFIDAMKGTFTQFNEDNDVQMVKTLAWRNQTVRDYNTTIREYLGYGGEFGLDLNETVTANSAITQNNQIIATTDSRWRVDSITPMRMQDIPGALLSLESLDKRNFRQGIEQPKYIKVFQPKSWTAANTLASKYRKAKEWVDYYGIVDGWADMRPTYAQTVHKSQGSTYMEVFVDAEDIAQNNKWYEVARLMYVALTRAKFKVHVFGTLPERYTRMSKQTAMEIFNNAASQEKITFPSF